MDIGVFPLCVCLVKHTSCYVLNKSNSCNDMCNTFHGRHRFSVQ